jgi:hypothetical protein
LPLAREFTHKTRHPRKKRAETGAVDSPRTEPID